MMGILRREDRGQISEDNQAREFKSESGKCRGKEKQADGRSEERQGHGLRTSHKSSVVSIPNPAMSIECNEPGPRPRESSDDA